MINGIDFSMSYPVQAALTACVVFPGILIIITKIRKLAGHNARQFLLSFLITTLGWLIALLILAKKSMLVSTESLYVSFFLYNGMILGYLEIWALLSRGYTLGLLLTFYKANAPLNTSELAGLYRGGEGLEWLIKHRFASLISTRMIALQGNKVVLTTRGIVIAFLYKLSMLFFGLRHSG